MILHITSNELRKKYPNTTQLKKYADEVFKSYPEKLIHRGHIVPKSYKKISNKKFEDLQYEELINIIMYFQKEKIKDEEERSTQKKQIGRMSNLKKEKEEYTVNYVYKYDNENDNSIWWLLAIIVFFIILFIWIKKSK
jgi:hypothetical protein